MTAFMDFFYFFFSCIELKFFIVEFLILRKTGKKPKISHNFFLTLKINIHTHTHTHTHVRMLHVRKPCSTEKVKRKKKKENKSRKTKE